MITVVNKKGEKIFKSLEPVEVLEFLVKETGIGYFCGTAWTISFGK